MCPLTGEVSFTIEVWIFYNLTKNELKVNYESIKNKLKVY